MRELKFKIWNGKVVGKPQSLGSAKLQYRKSSDIVLQYTGMKDSNGVEIYHGDIVEKVAKGWPDENGVSDIVWYDYGWHVRATEKNQPHDYYSHGLPINWGGYTSMKVIGNIYENPELLNDKP